MVSDDTFQGKTTENFKKDQWEDFCTTNNH